MCRYSLVIDNGQMATEREMTMIRKGDKIQVTIGRKLIDARAESDVFMGRMAGDDYDRPILRYSHQASPNDRHWCTGAAYCFTTI